MPHLEPQLTNCDWLSFSVHMVMTDAERLEGVHMNCPHSYTLLPQKTGTNQFKQRAILYNEAGDKVLTLLWQPHSNIIAPDTLFVEVANRWLYSNFDPLPLLLQIHNFTFGSLSRFDIATDFNPTTRQQQVIAMLTAGTAYVQGKREGSQFHDFKQGQIVERQARQLSWGSPQTNIKFKLYNKTKEITEVDEQGRQWCNKPYIRDYWQLNGLVTNRDVWRLEVSISSASTYQWRGEKLGLSIYDPAQYTPLYYDLVATRFVVRKNEGHTNKRYDHILDFLRITESEHYRLRRLDPATEQKHTDHAATLRNVIKQLEREETKCNQTIALSLLYTAKNIVDAANLQGYFLRSTGSSFEQWAADYLETLPQ